MSTHSRTRSVSLIISLPADTKRQMASTTKIMTAAVVLSTPGVNLNRTVTMQLRTLPSGAQQD